MLMHSIDLL
jgi:hypothetical protein